MIGSIGTENNQEPAMNPSLIPALHHTYISSNVFWGCWFFFFNGMNYLKCFLEQISQFKYFKINLTSFYLKNMIPALLKTFLALLISLYFLIQVMGLGFISLLAPTFFVLNLTQMEHLRRERLSHILCSLPQSSSKNLVSHILLLVRSQHTIVLTYSRFWNNVYRE